MLDGLPHRGCVVWAPTDAAAVGRLIAGFIQHASAHPSPKSMRLLVPVESFPGCSQIRELTDLWNHSLLLDKHRLSSEP